MLDRQSKYLQYRMRKQGKNLKINPHVYLIEVNIIRVPAPSPMFKIARTTHFMNFILKTCDCVLVKTSSKTDVQVGTCRSDFQDFLFELTMHWLCHRKNNFAAIFFCILGKPGVSILRNPGVTHSVPTAF